MLMWWGWGCFVRALDLLIGCPPRTAAQRVLKAQRRRRRRQQGGGGSSQQPHLGRGRERDGALLEAVELVDRAVDLLVAICS